MDEVRENTLRIRDEAEEDSLDWFEALYATANGNEYWIPWSDGTPHRFLVEWVLDTKSRGRALVVGCGLGEDAAYLSQQGWDVTAFDISSSAVQWAKENYLTENIDWQVADLLSLPEHWNGLFDLVLEVHILQAIPEPIRILAAPNLAPLLAPSGHLVCIGRLNEREEEFEGPPWPLSHHFIDSIGKDLKKIDFIKANLSSDEPEVIRYRSVWKKDTRHSST
jgi:2-polyprenyl-3-methyl-5-hydroxy-6-metoxy-1,4-benzoquinol methylase